jgi:hypothetical protein
MKESLISNPSSIRPSVRGDGKSAACGISTKLGVQLQATVRLMTGGLELSRFTSGRE